MAERTYEVRINGLVPTEALPKQLGEARVAEHEFRTALSGRFVDQAEPYAFRTWSSPPRRPPPSCTRACCLRGHDGDDPVDVVDLLTSQGLEVTTISANH